MLCTAGNSLVRRVKFERLLHFFLGTVSDFLSTLFVTVTMFFLSHNYVPAFGTMCNVLSGALKFFDSSPICAFITNITTFVIVASFAIDSETESKS